MVDRDEFVIPMAAATNMDPVHVRRAMDLAIAGPLGLPAHLVNGTPPDLGRIDLAAVKAFADAMANVTRVLQQAADVWGISWPLRSDARTVPGFRPNAPRRRMRTPGGRVVRRVVGRR